MSTGTLDESGDEQSEERTLKGFRKRWATRSAASDGAASDGGLSNLFDAASDADDEAVAKRFKSLPSGPNIDIVDARVDDELDFKKEPAASSRTKSHPHAREALLNTDFNVFKYPWEKGRLKKFFSNEPVVKLPVPKLKPGGRCGLA